MSRSVAAPATRGNAQPEPVSSPGEPGVHSFIVKVWLEETGEEARGPVWRGHITHVPGGERRYVRKLGEIPAFIAAHLEKMGVRLGLYWRCKARRHGQGPLEPPSARQ